MANLTKKTPHQAAQCTAHLSAVGDAVYVIGGKWKLRIIQALFESNMRFNELQRNIEGISARVLSNELKDLELNGFVIRKVDTGVPVVIEYVATEYCQTLDKVLQALSEWGTMHRNKIMHQPVSQDEKVLEEVL
jgi:DNA-binding HxlR family transcriptional regulator